MESNTIIDKIINNKIINNEFSDNSTGDSWGNWININ